ncbi:MAG: hypothetical protein NVS3B14_15400 [Ktedonobacteraceae bacterium]
MRRMLIALIFVLVGATFFCALQPSTPIRQLSTCVDVPASPDYLASNSEQDAIAAINNARAGEHLRALRLPGNFYRLNPAQQQFVLINLERTDRGIAPLRLDANLSLIARNYSRQLHDLHFFSHTSPIAGSFSERINSNPAMSGHYALAAENLAGNPVPGAGAVYEYMYDDSAEACGHRDNILDPQLTLVGIGEMPGSEYGSISAQEFIGPASWSPYHGAIPANLAPTIRIVEVQWPAQNSEQHQWMHYRQWIQDNSIVSFRVLHQNHDVLARITWFLDRVGNQASTGANFTLDLSSLAPGMHTLLAYAVDGEQDFGKATYSVFV